MNNSTFSSNRGGRPMRGRGAPLGNLKLINIII
jgi:hypothetical protein